MDVARCLALGADLVASARPMLGALHARGPAGLQAMITQWIADLRSVMFLTGARTLAELHTRPLVRKASL
jgi:isopentenyl diphosphate isomerase/L-lactate dehydrogenase-like FMN-dependent dehydrogenase